MAKVLVSLPDALLRQIDVEAQRRGLTRSELLQLAARREVGTPALPRAEIVERLQRVASEWDGPLDVVSEIRSDRAHLLGD